MSKLRWQTFLCKSSLSRALRTHPTVPSPPQTRIRKLSRDLNRERLNKNEKRLKITYAKSGPVLIMSKTWTGFRSRLNFLIIRCPWLSPDLEFTNTHNGLLPPHSAPETKYFDVNSFLLVNAIMNIRFLEHTYSVPPKEELSLRRNLVDGERWNTGDRKCP